MKNTHPIEKKPRPLPHDPRNEPITEKEKGSRSAEEAEKKVRQEEGVGLKGPEKGYPTGVSTNEKQRNSGVTEDEYGLPTGIRVDKKGAASSTSRTRR